MDLFLALRHKVNEKVVRLLPLAPACGRGSALDACEGDLEGLDGAERFFQGARGVRDGKDEGGLEPLGGERAAAGGRRVVGDGDGRVLLVFERRHLGESARLSRGTPRDVCRGQ